MTKDNSVKFKLAITYIPLMLGGVFENIGLQALGCLLLVFFIISSRPQSALLYIMAMLPNATSYTISSVGSNFLGLSFLIVLLKIASGQMGWKVRIPGILLIIGLYLAFLSFTRVLSGNFYDFAIICQAMIVVAAWFSILGSINESGKIQLISMFRYGFILMLIGMIVQFPFQTENIGRFRAVLDDCNYTGAACSFMLGITVITNCYKLPIKKNTFYMGLAIIAGLMTGSRGFMLSSGIILAILLFTNSFGKRTGRYVFVMLLLVSFAYILYLIGWGPVVSVYDNTIGRTIDLQDSYQDGQFMDVTSGRTLLWAYYMGIALADNSIFLFGKGFYNYFTIENGGYGLASHNMYVSSIIGIGLIGTILLLVLYFSIIKTNNCLHNKKLTIAYCSLVIGALTSYFFLDGILDTRLISYFAMTVMLMTVYSSYIKRKFNYE